MNIVDASSFLSYFLFFNGIIMLVACNLKTAVYGRYSESKGWGPLLQAKTAWMIMESPNIWISILIFYTSPYTLFNKALINSSSSSSLSSSSTVQSQLPFINALLLICFNFHYIHRSIIYPIIANQTKPNKMPLSIMLLAFLFCCLNGTTQALSLIYIQKYTDDWLYSTQFLLGNSIFLIGSLINIHSDYTLLSLRMKSIHERNHSLASKHTSSSSAAVVVKGSANSSCDRGTKRYFIPKGGLFEYISCANYFGEIVEWIGFAIACNSFAAAAFALCTFANLFPRAIKHHQWYRTKFDDYPKTRKALIPFLY